MLASLRKLDALFHRRDRVRLATLFALMVCAALLEVVGVGAIPAFIGLVVEPARALAQPGIGDALRSLGLTESDRLVVWGVLALIGVFAFKNGFLVLLYRWQMRFIRDRRIDLARRLVNAYMHAPYTFHLRRNTSELIRNVERETSIIAHQVLTALLEIGTRALILFAVLTFLFIVEPWITLAWVACFGALALFGVQRLSAKLLAFGAEEQRCRQRVLQALGQGFGSIKESRILSRESFFASIVGENVRRMSEAIRFKQFTSAAMAPLTEFIAIAGLFLIGASLVLLERSVDSILVTLSLFVVGLVRLRETVSAGMSHLANLRYSVVAVDPVHADLTELEAQRSAATESSDITPLPLLESLALDDVWHRYEGTEAHSLRGVTLQIPAGAAVGFVGGTGAGKSTLVDLVLGLLEPECGRILIDGVELDGTNIAAWQRNIGYVPQSIYLLDDTIRRNIALGREDAEIDEQALAAVLEAAQLDALVASLPRGIETMVGEHGVRLSGGERQRIGIARALYHDPEVLVLDEATSALDNTTERAIIDAVDKLKGRRTVLMIAHRLSTVRNADQLYFLKDGRIEAVGTYGELEAANSDFRRMVAS